MILIEDSITEDLINKLRNELGKNIPKHCWKSSSVTWDAGTRQGVVGSCITTPVSDNIQQLLDQELKSSLPKYTELICQYYIWQPQSAISWHNDKGSGDRSFGATLYLNGEWHPNNGGWFIWEDDDGHHTILPKKKFLVLNDNLQYHCVTPVSSGFRCTIQIWDKLQDSK